MVLCMKAVIACVLLNCHDLLCIVVMSQIGGFLAA